MPRSNAPVDSLSLEQLQAEFVSLGDELSIIDGRRRSVLARMNKLKAQASAKAALRDLNTDERAALKAALDKP